MNYYEHHLGDYAAATAHLSWDEDMAYSRLIRAYYHHERPIPADIKAACRLVRAESKAQRQAVETVLREFFELADDGWRQKRCDAEIAAYQASEPEREAKKSNEALRLRRHREERAALFALLNANGVHAAWNTPMPELRELSKRCAKPLPATAPATPATATHTQTHTQSNTSTLRDGGKRAGAQRPPDCPEGVPAGVWADWLALRRAKRAPVTDTVLGDARDEAQKAGMTLEAFLREWCARGSQGLKAEWLAPRAAAGGNVKPLLRQQAIEEHNRRVGDEWLAQEEARDATR